MLTLKIQQMTIDGHPYLCPECASEAFTLDGNGWIDALPVMGNCWLGHHWEEPLITLGGLKQIDAARSGRDRIEDIDTFEIVIGGAILAGVLHPDLTPEDVKAMSRIYWQKIIKPFARKQKNKAVRAGKKAGRQAATAVTNPVRDGVAYAKAAAYEAAWGLQAGGHEPNPDYQPEPINPCPACEGRGHHTIDTRLHKTTRIRCAVCYGTGEID